MGVKASGDAFKYDKSAMFKALMAINMQTKAMDEARAEITTIRRALAEDPECLSGERGEQYADTLKEIDDFVAYIAECTTKLRNKVTEVNAKYVIGLDSRKVAQAAAAAADKVKAAKNKGL